MNKMDYLKDVYSDFFTTNNNLDDSSVGSDITSYFDNINNLYITDESKELLKKIINYMNKYCDKKTDVYIPIKLVINSNSEKTTNDIINILKDSAHKYSYVKNNEYLDYSLYKIKDIDFTKYGIINVNDLSGINLFDVKEHKILIHNLEDSVSNDDKNITIISGKDTDITNFFLGYESFKNNYFSYIIETVSPSINDIYNNIINTIDIEKNNELLDYITKTYNNYDDFTKYENELVKYISLNNDIPKIKDDKSIDEVFNELDSLVGLDKVKKVLRELVDLMTLKKKTKDNLTINNINLHMVFLGNPGTGKTTIARMVADILYNLGYIKENKLIEVSSKDLVAEYVGQTAPKVASVIEKSMNGVLFIDEAYTLASNNNSYNDEAIATLIQAMENYRDKLVVIFAGYTKEMQDFLNSNSGIASRIGYTLEFDDYKTDELIKIFNNFMSKAGFKVNDDAINYLREIIDKNRNMKNFGNARFVRNIYEKTIIKHASRVKNNKQKGILTTITKEDISYDNLIIQ